MAVAPCSGRSCVCRGWDQGWGSLYSEVTWETPVNRMTHWWTDTTENIIFPQLCWRAVMIIINLHEISVNLHQGHTFHNISGYQYGIFLQGKFAA